MNFILARRIECERFGAKRVREGKEMGCKQFAAPLGEIDQRGVYTIQTGSRHQPDVQLAHAEWRT